MLPFLDNKNEFRQWEQKKKKKKKKKINKDHPTVHRVISKSEAKVTNYFVFSAREKEIRKRKTGVRELNSMKV